ncbi:MAG: hypothetical protein QXN15_04470 [Candidatus Jordarchaeales archaeon]|nr:hypothetical protein [Candidatus Jordarchaeia archaeon]
MIRDGILARGERKEKNWKDTKFGIPYGKAVERFRRDVAVRPDFDPASVFVWGVFMAKALLQVVRDVEETLGPEGQRVVNEALRKVGYEAAREMFEHADFPEGTSEIEKASFCATAINTILWTSVEKPEILNEDEAMFDILWCPLQDVYAPFDCRIQRYLVEGIMRFLREKGGVDFDVKFEWIIPAGAETCRFRIWRRKEGEEPQWEKYSQLLAERALRRWREKQGGSGGS